METRYAGFWIRFIADIIDSLILTIVSWILEYALLGLMYGLWSFYARNKGLSVPPFSDAFNAFWLQVFNIGVYVVIAFPYYVWGHFRFGTTLGKRPFKIYVVDCESLGPITVGQSIRRFFSYGLSYALLCTGFLMAAFHPQKRALHDLLAGTVSVRRIT
ncbi:MAG: hypothetical protein A3K03_13245 [Bdellovibrionales bacterium RIFOXYD1_FULL_44_7]|nr:MAG: hypothetical protein A3K03_13245 [Bdellovibrionales bacterium RIFOXYD1_FULL_44_7]